VHPRDDADHVVASVEVQRESADAIRIGQDRLPDNAHRHVSQAGRHCLGLLGDPAERLFAVHRLAARDEPDFIAVVRRGHGGLRHVSSLFLCPPRITTVVRPLSVDVLVAVVETVDGFLWDGDERTALSGQVHCARRIFDENRCLHCVLGRHADRERAMVSHEHGAGAVAGKGLDDAASDRVVPDHGERANRHRAAELVGDARCHTWDLLAADRPRHRVRRVGVDDAADLGHLPVDVCVGRGVAGGQPFATRRAGYGAPVQAADDHDVRCELLVADARGLDDEQVGSLDAARDIPARPDHQAIADQLGVQPGDILSGLEDGGLDLGAERAHDNASRRMARSRFIASLPPRPKWS
jgi:hypothetical protein